MTDSKNDFAWAAASALILLASSIVADKVVITKIGRASCRERV